MLSSSIVQADNSICKSELDTYCKLMIAFIRAFEFKIIKQTTDAEFKMSY